MHIDAVLDEDLRETIMPSNRFKGKANILVHANSDAAGATRNVLTSVAAG